MGKPAVPFLPFIIAFAAGCGILGWTVWKSEILRGRRQNKAARRLRQFTSQCRKLLVAHGAQLVRLEQPTTKNRQGEILDPVPQIWLLDKTLVTVLAIISLIAYPILSRGEERKAFLKILVVTGLFVYFSSGAITAIQKVGNTVNDLLHRGQWWDSLLLIAETVPNRIQVVGALLMVMLIHALVKAGSSNAAKEISAAITELDELLITVAIAAMNRKLPPSLAYRLSEAIRLRRENPFGQE